MRVHVALGDLRPGTPDVVANQAPRARPAAARRGRVPDAGRDGLAGRPTTDAGEDVRGRALPGPVRFRAPPAPGPRAGRERGPPPRGASECRREARSERPRDSRRGTMASSPARDRGQGQVDGDVVAADPPRPWTRPAGVAEYREPVELRVAPEPAGSAARLLELPEHRFQSMIAAISPSARALIGDAEDRGSRRRVGRAACRRIASPSRGPACRPTRTVRPTRTGRGQPAAGRRPGRRATPGPRR